MELGVVGWQFEGCCVYQMLLLFWGRHDMDISITNIYNGYGDAVLWVGWDLPVYYSSLIVYSIQMELSELAKLEDLDSPPSKDTYRTVKPPDRCVISYNFEQTNSINVTHNLLIGMFNDTTKKSNKNQSLRSPDNQKNKLFSIMPNQKKIARQDDKAISKVYDSKVVPRKYVNSISPHRQGQNEEKYPRIVQKTQPVTSKNQIEKQDSSQIQQQDHTVEQPSGQYLLRPKGFDEKRERQLSPYSRRSNAKRQKIQNRSKVQEGQAGNNQHGVDLDSSSEEQKPKGSLNQQKGHNLPSKQTESYQKTNRNSTKTKAQYNSQGNSSKGQLSINQSFEEHADCQKTQILQPVSERSSLEGLDSMQTEQRIPSRKEIQDEQLRELEQKIRKEEAANFKKGYFKKSDNTKQVLPFNVDIDPYPRQSKYLRRTSSSKKIITAAQTKVTSMGEVNKTLGYNQEHKSSNHKGFSSAKNGQLKQKVSGKQNYSLEKQDKNKFAIPSIHQVRQSKAKEFILNEMVKNNKNVVNSAHQNKVAQSGTTGIRKVHEIKKTNNNNINQAEKNKNHGADRNNRASQQQEGEKVHQTNSKVDLTQNHMIKGFKVSETSNNKASITNKGNSFMISKQNAEKKSAHVDERRSKINREQQPNTTINSSNKQVKGSSKDRSPFRNEIKEDSINIDKETTEQKDKVYNDSSRNARTNSRMRPNKSIEEQSNIAENSRSRTQHSVSNSTLKPTVPRNGKEKSYYNKNWRESELQKVMKQSKDNKKRRESQLSRDKKMSNTIKPSNMKTKRKEKSKEIDLDAEYEDKFGLLAQKNVTMNKKKGGKPKSQVKKSKKEDKQGGEIKEESSQSIKSSQKESHRSQSQHEDSEVEQNEQNSIIRQAEQLQQSQHQKQSEEQQNSQLQEQKPIKEQNESPLMITPQPESIAAQPLLQEEHNHQRGPSGEQQRIQVVNDAQGVHEIEQLIEQNGQLSRINCLEDPLATQQKINSPEVQSSRLKQELKEQQEEASVVPLPSKRQNNLQELLIATEEVPREYKISEPILDKVEEQFWCKEETGQNKQCRQQREGEKLADEKVQQKQGGKMQQKENSNEIESQMEVNLQVPVLQGTAMPAARRMGQQNETDYQEEEQDKIGDIPLKEENNRTEDFFQYNLKELSKLSDNANLTANITKYEPIDKNIIHYTRAPILSFLYSMPNQFDNYNPPFFPSSKMHELLSQIRHVPQIGVQAIDQAINILLSIDSWIVERVFEPFEDRDGKVGIWLYCQGKWTLFLQKKEQNFRKILLSATTKASQLLNLKFELQTILKLVSGVRIMRIKSSKKRVFNQLEFSLKKGHVLKALTSKQSKWGERLFTVGGVQVTKDHENVLQIKEQNQTYWVKQAKFKEIFEHFLLICTRKSHFWTNRIIQHRPSHKTVISIASQIPAHGSITLFYPSAAPSTLLLYKQLESKVLKFMGKIQQKSNQNGNLYFEFRLHGTYSIFLQAPEECLLAIESTTQLEIAEPEYVVSHTLKNEQCEYVELTNQIKRKSSGKQASRSGETLERLREKFINLVVHK